MSIDKLSPRQYEINGLIAKGYEAKQIAGKLFLSTDTVRTHIKHIKLKTGARNIADMTRIFILSLPDAKQFFAAIVAVMLHLGIMAGNCQNDLRPRRTRTHRVVRTSRANFYKTARYV